MEKKKEMCRMWWSTYDLADQGSSSGLAGAHSSALGKVTPLYTVAPTPCKKKKYIYILKK